MLNFNHGVCNQRAQKMSKNGSDHTDTLIRNLQLIAFLTRHYLEGCFQDETSNKPISFVHMNLLRILDTNPGKTVGDIAKFMDVSYPAATKTIDKLVRLGFLRRREDAGDRRIAHLHLTSSGKKIVERCVKQKRERVEIVIKAFGRENSERFNEQLNAFARQTVDAIPIQSKGCIHCGAFDPGTCFPKNVESSCGYLNGCKEIQDNAASRES